MVDLRETGPVILVDRYGRPVDLDNGLPVRYADSPSVDSFGRQRVSNSLSLFDSTFQWDLNPLQWVSKTSGTASVTHLPNESTALLSVGSASGDSVIYQTRRYLRYQPSKSQLINATGVFGTARENCRKRFGSFDGGDGHFFQDNGGAYAWGRRSSVTGTPVDTIVAQADWNIDTMLPSAVDPSVGAGPSRIILNGSKGQILYVDLEWLSLGRVRVGFVIDGNIWYVHEFNHANVGDGAYMKTATLPIRYEVTNTGITAGASTMKAICSAVISEGGQETERALPGTANNGVTAIGVTTRRPILSIRPKATFNSIVNRGEIRVSDIMAAVATNPCLLELVYGGTLTGASFASANASSIVEFDVAATAISGGIPVKSLPLADGSGSAPVALDALFSQLLPLTLDIDGLNPINFSLVATAVSGTSNIRSSINWTELK